MPLEMYESEMFPISDPGSSGKWAISRGLAPIWLLKN